MTAQGPQERSPHITMPTSTVTNFSTSDLDDTTENLLPSSPLRSFRREQLRNIERYRDLQAVRDSMPDDPLPGLSDDQLARGLVYDVISALTRAEMVLGISTEACEAHTRALGLATQARIAEIDLAERTLKIRERELQLRELAAETAARETAGRHRRCWAAILKLLDSVTTWMGAILTDPRTLAAAVGSVVTVFALLTAWLSSHL